jgi:ABC-type sugar transport system substrate-binding protein
LKQRALCLTALAVVAVFTIGCGVKGIQAQHGRVADRAEAAGKQAALDAGGRTKVPRANVSLLMMNGKDDSSKRLKGVLEAAGKVQLGWIPQPCDGKGDAKMLEKCATGAIDSGKVDFVFSAGIEPKDMSRILKKADFKGVPVINIFSSVAPHPLLAASYVPDDRAQARVLDRYMIDKFKQVPPAARKILVFTSSTGGGSARVEQLKSDIKGTGIQIVDEIETDLKRPATTKKKVKEELEKHDDLKAVWLANENTVEAAGKAVNKAFKDEEFPDRPLVLGFNADPKAAEALRDDEADAVADVPYDATLWIALDQTAELLGRRGRKKPAREGRVYQGSPIAGLPKTLPKYPLDFLDIQLVTKDNAPAKKKYREPKEDFVSFFVEKWREEFGPPPKP